MHYTIPCTILRSTADQKTSGGYALYYTMHFTTLYGRPEDFGRLQRGRGRRRVTTCAYTYDTIPCRTALYCTIQYKKTPGGCSAVAVAGDLLYILCMYLLVLAALYYTDYAAPEDLWRLQHGRWRGGGD